MIRLLFLAAMCCTFLCVSASAVEDAIAEKLASAKVELKSATEKARVELLAKLKEEAAQKAGDLKMLAKVQAETIAFAEWGTIPNVVSTNVYGTQIRVARAAMNAAYKESVSQYMKAGKTEIAKAIQTEQNEFNKDIAPAGAYTGALGMKARSGETKIANLKAGGGSPETEAAVARALIWLDKQQNKAKGSWKYDGSHASDNIAATGMALLPFLAAGQTHKVPKENKYQQTVEKGLTFLVSQQLPAGNFRGSGGMYSHAIATIAICEAYGMTGDKSKLLLPAKQAIEYITKAQGSDGSWGYGGAGSNGDTSIVGWQIQALHTARLCKDIAVPPETIVKAMKFLDKVANGPKKSAYGYSDNKITSPTLSSVGLLCRYYVDGWSPAHPGVTDGVERISKESMPTENRFDMYYYYYATQIMHFHEGDVWHKDWNPKMRDLLLKLQTSGKNNDKIDGSWDPDKSMIGSSCGRLGTTCLATLTLEVYYRHLPLYKRDTAGLKELERVK